MRRQDGIGGRVTEVVTDVSEPRVGGLDAGSGLERFRQAEVRGMRTVPQRVEHEHVDAADERPRLVGDPADVGEVGERSNPVAVHEPLPVPQRHRDDAAAGDLEGRIDHVEIDLGQAAAGRRLGIEDVRKCPADLVDRLSISVARDAAVLDGVEPPHVVETEDMVCVAVCEEHRVHTRQVVPQRLRAQVRRGVDQDARTVRQRHVDRRPRALIVRIGGRAHGARAADHRHAVAGAGAQEQQ